MSKLTENEHVCEAEYRGESKATYCPVCGAPAIGKGADPCDHLVFNYLYATGDMSYLAPSAEEEHDEEIQELRESFDDMTPEDLVDILGKDSRLTIINTATASQKGPTSFSTVCMFDFESE